VTIGFRRLAIALLLLAGVTACGEQSTTPAAADDPSRSAGGEASGAPSYSEETLLPALIHAVEKQESVHGVVTAQGVETTGDTVIGVDPAQARAVMEMDLGGPEPFYLEVIHHGGWLYARVEEDGKYLKVRPDDERLTPTMSAMHRDLDPLAMLRDLQEAATSVELVGDEVDDGHELQHFRVDVDYTQLAEGERTVPPGYEQIEYDVYVDVAGLPDHLVWRTPGHVEMTHAFSDWGERVEITPPAEDQLTKDDTLSPG
jgi:hypothetical protein